MGLMEILLVLFIVLKLVHVIDWSWTTVLIPLWVGLGLYGVLLLAWAAVRTVSKKVRR